MPQAKTTKQCRITETHSRFNGESGRSEVPIVLAQAAGIVLKSCSLTAEWTGRRNICGAVEPNQNRSAKRSTASSANGFAHNCQLEDSDINVRRLISRRLGESKTQYGLKGFVIQRRAVDSRCGAALSFDRVAGEREYHTRGHE